jgi:hypothetical protein
VFDDDSHVKKICVLCVLIKRVYRSHTSCQDPTKHICSVIQSTVLYCICACCLIETHSGTSGRHFMHGRSCQTVQLISCAQAIAAQQELHTGIHSQQLVVPVDVSIFLGATPAIEHLRKPILTLTKSKMQNIYMYMYVYVHIRVCTSIV